MMQFIDPHLYLKCHSSTGVFFTHFTCKIQVTGFFIHETLSGNGLMILNIGAEYCLVE